MLDASAEKDYAEHWLSAGNNSPWRRAVLKGNVKLTVCQGKVSWLTD